MHERGEAPRISGVPHTPFAVPVVEPGVCGGGALAGFSAGVLCKYPPAVFSVSESVVCAGWGTCTPLNTSDILNLYRV